MGDQELRDLLDELLTVSPECADRDELGRLVKLNARLKAFTVRYEMRWCSVESQGVVYEG